jgi:hypothetical protein
MPDWLFFAACLSRALALATMALDPAEDDMVAEGDVRFLSNENEKGVSYLLQNK